MSRRNCRRRINVVNMSSYDDDGNNMQLQQVLFNSAMLYNNSLNDVKKKGVDTSCQLVRTNGRINIGNSQRERGEPSCVYCTICKEPRSITNDTMKSGSCGHIYCEECIINYVRQRIKETLTEVNCPESDCKEILAINEYFVPPEYINQWLDAVREATVLASCDIIECPFGDCSGKWIDDKKGFLIRACPKCWRISCSRCRVYWHMGMKCETYQRLVRPYSN
ncbi:unnamed protein product [Withania somnifera]